MTSARRLVAATLAAAVALACVASLTGCADGRKRPAAVPKPQRKERSVFVVLGGRESSGSGVEDALHTSWPQQVFGTRFPNGTVYVNLARDGATVAWARAKQLSLAVGQRPTVAVVWLGAGDAAAGTLPAQFGRDLRSLLERLRATGAPRVLVASPPAGAAGSQFTAEIALAARSTGAEVVPLSASAWNPDAPKNERAQVQAAAAAEFSEALEQ